MSQRNIYTCTASNWGRDTVCRGKLRSVACPIRIVSENIHNIHNVYTIHYIIRVHNFNVHKSQIIGGKHFTLYYTHTLYLMYY